MDIDTRLLRSFAVVCEEGQLTAAASRLFVSQPTLTKQVRQLETQLGVELFQRSRSGMTPTAAGNALAAHATALLSAWDGALRATREAAGRGCPAALRVGFEGSTINLMNRQTVTEFTRLMPGWQVEMRQNNWFDPSSGLAAGEIDLALWHAPQWMAQRYAVAVLGVEERCAVLPAGHRLAGRELIDFTELVDDPFVAIPQESAYWRDYWLAMDERRGRPVRIGAVAHNADEWLAAVACGQGIGFAPQTMSRLAPRSDVVYRPVRGLSPSQVGLYWPRDRPLTPAMSAFIRSCRTTIAFAARAVPVGELAGQATSEGSASKGSG